MFSIDCCSTGTLSRETCRKKLAITNLAKGQAVAQHVKGLVLALAIAQEHIHNSLPNLLS